MIIPDDEDMNEKGRHFTQDAAPFSEYPYKIHNAITEVFSKLRTGLFPSIQIKIFHLK
jgi:hypothetical protein